MSDHAVNATDTDDAEPIHYVGYTRPSSFPGTPEQLEALASAYLGFQEAFIINAVLFLILWSVVGVMGGEVAEFNRTLLTGVIIVSTVTTLISIRPCRRFAFGLGRTPAHGTGTAIVLGLQSCLCFGLFGFSSVMRTTIAEIRKYGVQPRFWGISNADVAVRAAEMRTNPNPPPPDIPRAITEP